MTASNALIRVLWSTNQFLNMTLRMDHCSYPGNIHSIVQAVPLPADHRWHHIAFVRSGGNLEAYLDYELYNYYALNAISDGSYHPTTNHYVVLGDVDYTENSSMDEVRLSGRALTLDEFITINGAAFVGDLRVVGTNCSVRVEQRDHTGYRVEINTNNLTGNGWVTWYTSCADAESDNTKTDARNMDKDNLMTIHSDLVTFCGFFTGGNWVKGRLA